MLVKVVINMLQENRGEIYTELNDMINVPMISESREQACIESIYDAVLEVIAKILSE